MRCYVCRFWFPAAGAAAAAHLFVTPSKLPSTSYQEGTRSISQQEQQCHTVMRWLLLPPPSLLAAPGPSSSSSSTSSSSSGESWESKRGVLLAASASVLCASAAFAIYQLTKILFSVVRDSEYEADKLITAVTATIHSDSPGGLSGAFVAAVVGHAAAPAAVPVGWPALYGSCMCEQLPSCNLHGYGSSSSSGSSCPNQLVRPLSMQHTVVLVTAFHSKLLSSFITVFLIPQQCISTLTCLHAPARPQHHHVTFGHHLVTSIVILLLLLSFRCGGA
jgi:hypothetical protein